MDGLERAAQLHRPLSLLALFSPSLPLPFPSPSLQGGPGNPDNSTETNRARINNIGRKVRDCDRDRKICRGRCQLDNIGDLSVKRGEA